LASAWGMKSIYEGARCLCRDVTHPGVCRPRGTPAQIATPTHRWNGGLSSAVPRGGTGSSHSTHPRHHLDWPARWLRRPECSL